MNRNLVLPLALVFALLVTGLCAQDLAVFRDAADRPRAQLARYLNKIGLEQLQQRERDLTQVKTTQDMERRKKVVREKILRLVGGLPDYSGPLNTRQAGTLDRGDYRIEKIIYESLPGFFVPANVYVPAQGNGPFPAVLNPVGHSTGGKASEREIAIGLVRKGFVVLKYDPIGQGERLQYYDPDTKASRVGGPTAEHSHANGHTMLIGENVARYRIWDGMRGIDYLLTRRDVDPNRIGCTGCSGGGTLTTYISALDERVKAAAPACYINSWQELLAGPGPQDAEQSFPRFLVEGLDIADYVELFAPKPWLIASTIQDFFPLEGARQTYEEARRIYALYGAADRLAWHIGPGPHGVPRPSREAIYEWFIKWLKEGAGDRVEAEAKPDPPGSLLCTSTGQVSDSLGGETVFTLNKKRAASVIPARQPVSSNADLERLRSRLAKDVREVASTAIRTGGPPPPARIRQTVERNGYRLDVISYEPEKGIQIPAVLMVPGSAGLKPAIVAVDSRPMQAIAAPGGDLEDLVKAGYLVLALYPRGISEIAEPPAKSVVAHQSMAALAAIVGKTLIGMRAEDIIRGIDYLCSRDDVDRGKIIAVGRGAPGVALLHAAVLDERIGQLLLQETIASYRLAVDRPLHRDLYDVGIPGVLKKYDLDELLTALGPRPVTIIDPVDALGVPLRPGEFQDICRYAFETDAALGRPKRLEVAYRRPEEPLRRYIQ